MKRRETAMTQLGYYDGDYEASYLELAEFITIHGSHAQQDLEQLWRRIVFNLAVSNTDDYLRNHGFILDKQGWRLSLAYDINPVTPAHGLHLNINESENQLDFVLALEVAEYFRISPTQAKNIQQEVRQSVSRWIDTAKASGYQQGRTRKDGTSLPLLIWQTGQCAPSAMKDSGIKSPDNTDSADG